MRQEVRFTKASHDTFIASIGSREILCNRSLHDDNRWQCNDYNGGRLVGSFYLEGSTDEQVIKGLAGYILDKQSFFQKRGSLCN